MQIKGNKSHLIFNTSINRLKPRNLTNPGVDCPFCDVANLNKILSRKDSIILLENKYPVLENAYQLVLIETDQCDAELSTYSPEHLTSLFQFAIKHWLEVAADQRYQSTIMFKNHGPLSGGSLRHPHMQIIGLEDVKYQDNIQENDFIGITICKADSVELNISTHPRIGFYEFNVILKNIDSIPTMALFVQRAAHYILNHFRGCTSYNLFFYQLNDQIAAKIIPRYVTTPLFIGYSLKQVAHNVAEIAQDVKDKYRNE